MNPMESSSVKNIIQKELKECLIIIKQKQTD